MGSDFFFLSKKLKMHNKKRHYRKKQASGIKQAFPKIARKNKYIGWYSGEFMLKYLHGQKGREPPFVPP